LENQYGFTITDAATNIVKVSLENDSIDLNYATNVNAALTSSSTITAPTIVTQILKSKQGDSEILLQNYAGTSNIRFIPGNLNYIQSSTNVLSFSRFGDGAIKFSIDHNNLAPHNTGTLISKYNISIRPPAGNLNFNLYKCETNEQVSLYSHTNTDGGFVLQKAANDDGLKINMFHSGAYRPM
jgi:hypothetical protein